ncbi:DUF4232 domain-containing protein [Amycolatopsis alkalitolerans]|uniref:DUF4232 domain-containing protein n=1 Tax=Amycolatopsis alkalitolerans TaxID=2547244 RepID=A0A5C4M874_9PSEU|nr:DUF4232 domain-containing protein [Amycolatopsis alkalitolerans]TNC27406.1 DUF4232 domain-containing protein [Amycolatopsis alkalitolerans]
MVRVRISQVGLAASAAAVAFAVSACGGGTNNAQPPGGTTSATTPPSSSSPAPSSTSSAAPSSSPAAGPGGNGLCKSGDLKLSFGQGNGAAGTVYRPLIFTNVSDHPCTIQGFPGVSYVGGSDGHQIGQAAFRVGTKGAAITLNKGDTASTAIGFVNVQNYDPVTCQPQPVRGLRVYPPQETASMFIEQAGTACANQNIPGNQLTVKTLVKGSNAQ